MDQLQKLINRCEAIAFDMNFTHAKEWKTQEKGRVLVGYMPIYFPREIIHAAGGLAVGIMGTGDRKQVIKGDAYYQSYICHMPRGIIELALDGNLDGFDGFVFPSICDVIRNLSGMFKVLKKGSFVKYMDFPQNFSMQTGGAFYKEEMQDVLGKVFQLNEVEVTAEKLNNSVGLYNKNRRLLEDIYDIRQDHPWRLSMSDLYCITRAGLLMPVEEHNLILEEVIGYIKEEMGHPMDNIRVVVSGSFCEQPPLGLIKAIENAGCYIVDDDFILGSRWIKGEVGTDTDDPLQALSKAYLEKSTFSSSVYDVNNPKEKRLADLVMQRKADGVIFAAPSFCDPALLDAPIFQKGCDDYKVRYISFQYNENTGQFKVIKEQVGAFSDSIKLWEDEAVA